MRNLVMALAAALAVVAWAGEARADIGASVRDFCIRSQGKEADFTAAAVAAGWRPAPRAMIPADMLDDESNTVAFLAPGVAPAQADMAIMKSPKVQGTSSDAVLPSCILSVGVPTPDLLARLEADLGPSGLSQQGEPMWAYSYANGQFRSENDLLGNTLAIDDAMAERQLSIVLLMQDPGAGLAAVFVATTRDRTR